MKRLTYKIILATVLAASALSSQLCVAKGFHLSTKQMEEVINIANAINVLRPRLEESKYLEYAMGIHKAASHYGIDPMVLIAITQQETSFREELPEGAAGEIGICQIRKMWLANPNFIREFKIQKISDLKKPAKSFIFAAWILKGLQIQVTKGSLPYWSYYNSVRFENRFKYFLGVNRHIATLKRFDPQENRLVASIDSARRVPQLAKPAKKASNVNLSQNDLGTGGNRWIPDAFRRIEAQQADREIQSIPADNNVRPAAYRSRRRASVSAALIRAAVDLDAGIFGNKPVQD